MGRPPPSLAPLRAPGPPLVWPLVWAMHALGEGAAGHITGVTPTSCSCDGGRSALSPPSFFGIAGRCLSNPLAKTSTVAQLTVWALWMLPPLMWAACSRVSVSHLLLWPSCVCTNFACTKRHSRAFGLESTTRRNHLRQGPPCVSETKWCIGARLSASL